jgi:hypothetical protein
MARRRADGGFGDEGAQMLGHGCGDLGDKTAGGGPAFWTSAALEQPKF